jgi:hypothetical protein
MGMKRYRAIRTRLLVVVMLMVMVLYFWVLIGTQKSNAQRIRDGRVWTASYYTGSVGACGSLKGFYVASKFYKCGQHLTLVHQGKAVRVTVMDRCSCGIDMAKSAFSKLAPTSQGLVKVRAYYGWKR